MYCSHRGVGGGKRAVGSLPPPVKKKWWDICHVSDVVDSSESDKLSATSHRRFFGGCSHDNKWHLTSLRHAIRCTVTHLAHISCYYNLSLVQSSAVFAFESEDFGRQGQRKYLVTTYYEFGQRYLYVNNWDWSHHVFHALMFTTVQINERTEALLWSDSRRCVYQLPVCVWVHT